MGENSGISWTDHTFNPWHGCTKIANPQGSGCDHCYAETSSVRWGRDIWGKDADRLQMSESTWRKPLKWNAEAEERGEPFFVFCASMGDVFEDRRDLDASRDRLYKLIEATGWLTWLLLTKRPEQINRLTPQTWKFEWPVNVWVGTSVEHQAAADLRIPRLLEVSGARRFLSCEPLLGDIDLSNWLNLEWMDALRVPGDPMSFRGEGGWGAEMFSTLQGDQPKLDWIIVGGESGNQRRVLNLHYMTDIIDQCRAAEIPVWVKQDSGMHSGSQGRIPDSLWIQQRPPAVVPA